MPVQFTINARAFTSDADFLALPPPPHPAATSASTANAAIIDKSGRRILVLSTPPLTISLLAG